jgi:hypothetical protein
MVACPRATWGLTRAGVIVTLRCMRLVTLSCLTLLIACDSKSPVSGDANDTSDTRADDTNEADSVAPETDSAAVDTTLDDTSEPETSPDTVSPDGADGADTTSIGSFTLTLGSWNMSPAEETTRCVVKRLGNADTIRVSQIRTNLSRGSHHFIVYKSPDTVEQTAPFPCAPFSETLNGQTVPLMISQIREETLTLPDGVAFELAPNQMIRLEAHYLNYFPEPIDTGAEVTFELAPSTATELADFMFYGTTQVYIPAGQKVTTPWKFHPVPTGVKVFGLTGHTHALGTNVEIEKATTRTDPGLSVYPPEGRPFDWAEAPIAHFEPPLDFEGDGFRFRCSWNNTTQRDAHFGESATQEMCFFWAYYYPSQGVLIRF